MNGSTIPEDLFYYNVLATSYNGTFRNVRNLIYPTRMFNLTSLSIVDYFDYFQYNSSSLYSPTGTVQDVWNYATSASSADAFINCDSLDNYNDIPAAWGGGGA